MQGSASAVSGLALLIANRVVIAKCINCSSCDYSQENVLVLGYVTVFTGDYSLLVSILLRHFTHLSFRMEMKCWCIIVV